VNRLSDDIETYENFTGFGLYDRQFIDLSVSLAIPILTFAHDR